MVGLTCVTENILFVHCECGSLIVFRLRIELRSLYRWAAYEFGILSKEFEVQLFLKQFCVHSLLSILCYSTVIHKH